MPFAVGAWVWLGVGVTRRYGVHRSRPWGNEARSIGWNIVAVIDVVHKIAVAMGTVTGQGWGGQVVDRGLSRYLLMAKQTIPEGSKLV